MKFTTNMKNIILLNGLNCRFFNLLKFVTGNINIINNALNIAITPNNLLGIDLNIA
ncbi:hypothetical protein GCM10028820_34270 [Tessaracoccus terricola]